MTKTQFYVDVDILPLVGTQQSLHGVPFVGKGRQGYQIPGTIHKVRPTRPAKPSGKRFAAAAQSNLKLSGCNHHAHVCVWCLLQGNTKVDGSDALSKLASRLCVTKKEKVALDDRRVVEKELGDAVVRISGLTLP